MAVTAQTPRKVSTAAAGATVFPYDFKILSKNDLLVQVDGVTKVVDVDFTVDGVAEDAGGDITFLTPLVGGEKVMRKRNMAFERSTDFQSLGDLRSSTLNNDQDLPVLLIQQVDEQVGRALGLPADSEASAALPAPVAGGVPMVNDAEDGFAWAMWGTNPEALASLAMSGGAALVGFPGGHTVADLASTDPGKGPALVGFKQAGTGAVSRTVEDKARELVSVADFDTLAHAIAAATGKPFNLNDGSFGGVPWARSLPAGKIRIVAGAIRQNSADRTKWDFISDASHAPVGVLGTQAAASSATVTITFEETFAKVIAFIAAPDEDFANAHNMTVGASVGLSSAAIQVSGSLHGSAFIRWNGTTWAVSQGTGQLFNPVFSYSNGVLTVTHDYIPGVGLQVSPWIGTAAAPLIPVVRTVAAGSFTVQWMDPTTGLMKTDASPLTSMQVKVDKTYNEGIILDGTAGSDTLGLEDGNIWFFGIFEAS